MKLYLKSLFFVVFGFSVIGLLSMNFENDSEPINEYILSSSEQKITPKTFILSEKNYVIEPTRTKAVLTNNAPLTGYTVNNDLLYQKAFAISSTQNTISVTQWQIEQDFIRTVDSQGNFFTVVDGNKIGRADITTEIQTEWEIPNSLGFLTLAMDTDSSDNVYFTKFDFDRKFQLAKLDHNTDTFTEWDFPTGFAPDFVVIDSSDNVYFSNDGGSEFLGRLDPSTNTITTWCCVTTNGLGDMLIDSLGNVYLVTGLRNIIQFEPSSNTVTIWPTFSNNHIPHKVAVDSNGDIFFTETVPVNTFAIAKLDPVAQTIKEWLVPEFDKLCGGCNIAVDSNGNVFFDLNGFNRFVPSTNAITSWGSPISESFLEIDSSDIFHWADFSGRGGTIT